MRSWCWRWPGSVGRFYPRGPASAFGPAAAASFGDPAAFGENVAGMDPEADPFFLVNREDDTEDFIG